MMSKNSLTFRIIGIILLVASIIALLVWGNLNYIKATPGGLDFLAHWQGTRSFLKNGINPYSEQTAANIKSQISEMGVEETGEYRFVSSLISFVVLVPFSLIKDFAIARTVWMTFLEVILLTSVWLVAKWLRCLPSAYKLMIIFVSTFSFYPTFKGVMDGSLAIVVVF